MLNRLPGHTNAVTGVSFSPDGRTLASASEDGAIFLWDVPDDPVLITQSATLTEHKNQVNIEVNAVAFSQNGKTLASGGADDRIILWDVTTQQIIDASLQHSSDISRLAFLPNAGIGGDRLVSGSLDNSVILWNVTRSQPLRQPLIRQDSAALSLSYSPDGDILALGNADGTITLWSLVGESGNFPEKFATLTGFAQQSNFVIGLDGETLTLVAQDDTLLSWGIDPLKNISEQPVETLLPGLDETPFRLAALQNGFLLVAEEETNTLKLWNLETGQVAMEIEADKWDIVGDEWRITRLALHPDGNSFAVGICLETSQDGRCNLSEIQVWSVTSSQKVGEPLTGHRGAVLSVAFNPANSNMLASGDANRGVILWDLEKGLLIGQPLAGHFAGVSSLVFSPDGNTLVSGDENGVVILWKTGEEAWTELACESAGRNLSHQELALFFPGQELIVTCPQWPEGE